MTGFDHALHAPIEADKLKKREQVAVLLMDEKHGLRQPSSGIPLSVFKGLRTKAIARSPDEVTWYLVPFGAKVREVLVERGAVALG